MIPPDKNAIGRKCAQCGAALPANLPAEFCPKCLLQAGLGTQPVSGPAGTIVLPAMTGQSRGLPQPGELFGHYRIIRLLGEGGMGAAFEADDLESGRCVALKLLSHKLDSPEARERFFREGRLAASINHPNSVYVFGTEEIGGTPAISMELVPGGTLQNRLDERGPLPVNEAVDAVLQIIAGLEAAQSIGILHRDIKPSNCFRDTDGTVKIGDFGLSISTTVRTEPTLTAAGTFLGTPAFCPPEQLRGDELNARSDMYSVGVTLFYLLTGHMPFEGKNPVQLLATVLEQRAPSPKKFRPAIPTGLAKVILRCLEKQPGERFKNYPELAQALASYSSTSPTPATLGLRFVAGVIDTLVLSGLSMATMAVVAGFGMDLGELLDRPSNKMFAMMFGSLFIMTLYYAVTEGFWGATVGKAICRLRVVKYDNSPPGFGRALGRAALYVLLPTLPALMMFVSNPTTYLKIPAFVQPFIGFSQFIIVILLFSSTRRRNGFLAWHDRLTKTRILSRVALHSRPALMVAETPPATTNARASVGPYHVLEPLGKTNEAEWLLGYDLRLLRKVWIRKVAPGTPTVPASLRNIGRPGRLRWLTGLRSPEENWDAYEAMAGQPLVTLTRTPQPWGQVRYWLYDLATELSAAQLDGTVPFVLSLDRVWITTDGRAKLLDFAAPGIEDRDPAMPPPLIAPQAFAGIVATFALTGHATDIPSATPELALRLPVYARQFLKQLPQFPNPADLATALRPLLHRVTQVSRWRRAAIAGGCLMFPLLTWFSVTIGTKVLDKWNDRNPGLLEINYLMQQRTMGLYSSRPQGPSDQQQAIYIAAHHRSVVTNEATWMSTLALGLIKGDARQFVERSVAAHPAPTAGEIADADRAMKPFTQRTDFSKLTNRPGLSLTIFAVSLALYVGLPALLAALLCRGGLVLLAAGVTFVRRDGMLASRLRVFWRSIVTWGPILLATAVPIFLGKGSVAALPILIASVLICGAAVLSILLPARGLPDRLAGTWPVPR